MYDRNRAEATKAKHPESEAIGVPVWLHYERAVWWLYKRWPPELGDDEDEKVQCYDRIRVYCTGVKSDGCTKEGT